MMLNRRRIGLGIVTTAALACGAAVILAHKPPVAMGYTLPQIPGVVAVADPKILCAPGYSTRSVRPPSSYTDGLKRNQLSAAPTMDQNPAAYEEDHRTPLELGGDPRNPDNLWPELYERAGEAKGYGAESKDRLENYLHKQVCSGRMRLSDAQAVFAGDWFKWRDMHIPGL